MLPAKAYPDFGFIVELWKDLIQQISDQTRFVMSRRVECDQSHAANIL